MIRAVYIRLSTIVGQMSDDVGATFTVPILVVGSDVTKHQNPVNARPVVAQQGLS